jgi:hypothetical protein
MKEVFTKRFWQGVKKTFDEALEDPPPAENALEAPAGDGPGASSTSATPPSSSPPSSATASPTESPDD